MGSFYFKAEGGTGKMDKDVHTFEGKREGSWISHLRNSLLCEAKILTNFLKVTTLDQKMEFIHLFTQQMLLSIFYVPPLH